MVFIGIIWGNSDVLYGPGKESTILILNMHLLKLLDIMVCKSLKFCKVSTDWS